VGAVAATGLLAEAGLLSEDDSLAHAMSETSMSVSSHTPKYVVVQPIQSIGASVIRPMTGTVDMALTLRR
jgi:hypothetical protein